MFCDNCVLEQNISTLFQFFNCSYSTVTFSRCGPLNLVCMFLYVVSLTINELTRNKRHLLYDNERSESANATWLDSRAQCGFGHRYPSSVSPHSARGPREQTDEAPEHVGYNDNI